jgi:tRNA(Ser,Leu) C12 N-acetylase TAN1
MHDWNVVVSVHEGRFVRACQLLGQFGRVERTEYYNVLVMKVEDTSVFVTALADLVSTVPDVLEVVSRAMPAAETFTFQSAEEFEAKAREIALGWQPALAGKAFHVRLHRRGFRERLSSQEEERLLDEVPSSGPARRAVSASTTRMRSSTWRRSATAPACRSGRARICPVSRS